MAAGHRVAARVRPDDACSRAHRAGGLWRLALLAEPQDQHCPGRRGTIRAGAQRPESGQPLAGFDAGRPPDQGLSQHPLRRAGRSHGRAGRRTEQPARRCRQAAAACARHDQERCGDAAAGAPAPGARAARTEATRRSSEAPRRRADRRLRVALCGSARRCSARQGRSCRRAAGVSQRPRGGRYARRPAARSEDRRPGALVSSVQGAPHPARAGLAALMVGAALALVACSSAKNPERPAPLVKKLVQRVHVRTVWRTHLRREAPKLRVGLVVAVDGQRAFIASHNGRVEALDLAHGRRLWRTRVRATLSGGPGAGAGLVVVGGAKGNVLALSENDGRLRWQRRVNSEILSAPAVGRDFVVVRGVDGRLQALATATGADTWIATQEVPRLSLRGTSSPILDGDLAICGFDDGHVLAVERSNGMLAWNAAVGQPHGTSELQRLIDLDAPVVPAGDDLFAVAYQGRVARLDLSSGRIAWTHDFSSY